MEIHKGWVRYTDLSPEQDSLTSMAESVRESKKHDKHSPREQAEEMLKGYPDQIYQCVANGKRHHSGDFYVQVLFKADRLTPDYINMLCVARGSCPDAFYDQGVYRYTKHDDKIEFLWKIPSLERANKYRTHVFEIGKDDIDLYEAVMQMDSGELARRTFFYNNPDNRIVLTGS